MRHTTIIIYRALCGAVVLILLGACTATSPVLEWRDEAYNGPAFNHVLVIAVSENLSSRRVFEDTFVRELRNIGVNSIPSASIMPGEEKVEKETVRRAIEGRNVDAVLVTHLVAIEEKEAFMPGPTPATTYGAGYWGHYSYAWDNAFNRGYYEKYQVLKLESNLYDVATEKPVWAMQSETMEVDKINTLVNEVIKLNIQSLRKEKLI